MRVVIVTRFLLLFLIVAWTSSRKHVQVPGSPGAIAHFATGTRTSCVAQGRGLALCEFGRDEAQVAPVEGARYITLDATSYACRGPEFCAHRGVGSKNLYEFLGLRAKATKGFDDEGKEFRSIRVHPRFVFPGFGGLRHSGCT